MDVREEILALWEGGSVEGDFLRAGPGLADHVDPLGVLPGGGGSLDLGLVMAEVVGGRVGIDLQHILW